LYAPAIGLKVGFATVAMVLKVSLPPAHVRLSARYAAGRRSKLNKRRQPFICTHNEPLSVAAMRVSNEDRSPAGINR